MPKPKLPQVCRGIGVCPNRRNDGKQDSQFTCGLYKDLGWYSGNARKRRREELAALSNEEAITLCTTELGHRARV